MNQIQRKSPFWSLAGPLLAYLAIQWGVQTAIQFVIELPYAMRAYAELLRQETIPKMPEIMEACMEAMEPGFEILVRYQVEIAGAAALCTLILTVILFSKDRKLERACGAVLPEKAPFSKYWALFILGAAGCAAVNTLMIMVQLAFYDDKYQQVSQNLYAAGFPMQLLVLGCIMPLAEELIFRGILFKRFRERQGFWYSAVCSSVFFALMHSSTIQTVYGFLLGLALAYVYEKFGSFKAPVILHITLNTGSVIFTELGALEWIVAEPERMAGTAIAAAFICSIVFVKIQRTGKPVRERQPDKPQNPPDLFQ